jgi:uncharacterized protein YcfJ
MAGISAIHHSVVPFAISNVYESTEIMKHQFLQVVITLAAGCGIAHATEYGQVISSVAVQAQVGVPQLQCTEQSVLVQPRTSGGGALLGAVVGGVIGHNLGDGFGRAATTGLGAVAGSVIGDRTEAANTPPAGVPVRICQTITQYQSQVIGYDVTYEFQGKRYTTRLAQNPGERIALDVSVTPVGQPVDSAIPVAVPPTVIYAQAPVYGYDTKMGSSIVLAPQLVYGRYWRRGY